MGSWIKGKKTKIARSISPTAPTKYDVDYAPIENLPTDAQLDETVRLWKEKRALEEKAQAEIRRRREDREKLEREAKKAK